MHITHRVVSKKRHTKGYLLNNGERVTRSSAVKMARSGMIKGVGIRRGPYGMFIARLPVRPYNQWRTLYDLPEVVEA